MRHSRQCETSAKARTAGNQRGRRPCNSSCQCRCTSMFRLKPLSRTWISGSTWGSSWRRHSRYLPHRIDHPRPDPQMDLVTQPTANQRLGTFRDEQQQDQVSPRLARARTWISTCLNLAHRNHCGHLRCRSRDERDGDEMFVYWWPLET